MEALLWKSLPHRQVQCLLCAHQCVLPPQEPPSAEGRGRCGVRSNIGGVMCTMVSDGVISLHADPVEKKPLYHYLPGTQTFSLGTEGCNLSCAFCQNADISQRPRLTGTVRSQPISPQELVDVARAQQCASVAFTYNEPTVFVELMSATADVALDAGLGTVMVSNGFQSAECLQLLRPRIHAANIDLKSMRETVYREVCGARLAPVLDNLRRMIDFGWWLEVTTLLVPGMNDSAEELQELAEFVATQLGRHVPWHVSAFHGAFRMEQHPATPASAIDRACAIGLEHGLHFVYPGNVAPGSTQVDTATRCPACHAVCLDRSATRYGRLASLWLTPGTCPVCNASVPGIWRAGS